MTRKHRYRAPGSVYTVSILAFLLATSVAVLYARGYTIDPQRMTVKKTGLLVIRSIPAGAFVTLDNRLRPERTPARLKLPAGTYSIKVDKSGLRPFEKQVRVDEQSAVFEENILLFRTQPVVTRLGERVTAFALAPSGKRVAFLQTVPEGNVVRVADADGSNPVSLATLDSRYGAVTSFAWSGDSASLVIAIPSETRTLSLAGGQTTTPVGGTVAFAPGSRDTLLHFATGKLTSFIAGTSSETLLAENATAFAVGPSFVLASTTAAGLIRIDLPSASRRVVSSDRTYSSLSSSTSDRVYGRDAAGDLYRIETNGSPERIAEDVAQYRALPDGSFVSIVSAQEIRLYDADKRQSSLVTRLASAIDESIPLADGHYIAYRQAGSLHTIAADGSNDQTVAGAGTAPLTFLEIEAALVTDSDKALLHLELLDR